MDFKTLSVDYVSSDRRLFKCDHCKKSMGRHEVAFTQIVPCKGIFDNLFSDEIDFHTYCLFDKILIQATDDWTLDDLNKLSGFQRLYRKDKDRLEKMVTDLKLYRSGEKSIFSTMEQRTIDRKNDDKVSTETKKRRYRFKEPTKLYVGEFSSAVTHEDVETLFRKRGPCVVLMKRGFCFVFFDRKVHADNAVKELHKKKIFGELEGKIRVEVKVGRGIHQANVEKRQREAAAIGGQSSSSGHRTDRGEPSSSGHQSDRGEPSSADRNVKFFDEPKSKKERPCSIVRPLIHSE